MSRRLDALFAERVLGWKRHGGHWCTPNKIGPLGGASSMIPVGLLPSYTADLSAAWEGVERAGPNVKMTGPGFGGWQVDVFDCTAVKVKGQSADQDTAMAVVLACLRAVGVSEEEIRAAQEQPVG